MNAAISAEAETLLTIAIPTWNRQDYLRQNLAQLKSEIDSVQPGLVDVLVSDNCSSDATPQVVADAAAAGLPVKYVRNSENVGWARNFAQCVDLARSRYLLLFGDDDVLYPGTLALLLDQLRGDHDYGVICLRPYGYETDFRGENPGGRSRTRHFDDAGRFLVAISQYFTLTSALVLNRHHLRDVDPRQFVLTNLATFHLVLRAALAAKRNLYLEQYLIASKRQNSFSYEYYKVFVDEFWSILDAHRAYGLRAETIRQLESWRLFSYYPFYMLDLRISQRWDRPGTYRALKARFGTRLLFRLWLEPTLWLPLPLAIFWGTATVAIGRALSGDFRRGVRFVTDRAIRLFCAVARGR